MHTLKLAIVRKDMTLRTFGFGAEARRSGVQKGRASIVGGA
jgi:hypothetical protein